MKGIHVLSSVSLSVWVWDQLNVPPSLLPPSSLQTAVTILQRGEALYPFHGLQGFPENYPMLVTGDAQVCCMNALGAGGEVEG